MKFKCDMCGKTFKIEQQTDIETHLKYSHSFQDIPLIKKYAKQTFNIHEKIKFYENMHPECNLYIENQLEELKSLLENER